MYDGAFNRIERELRNEEGVANELDYVEQTSWVLFLKYLHDLENERRDRAELDGTSYSPIITGPYVWDQWAAPKTGGQFDHNKARIGEDLIKFVDTELFPHLASFRQSATGPHTLEYKIGEIFTELRNKFRSGYILRDVLETVDELAFNTQAERHELSQLYETRIRRMGNAGRNGGEYYTPRPLIRAMIKVTDPKLGETIYDGAVGSAGFLCEAFDHLRPKATSASQWETLQRDTFFGQEKKGLAYIIGIMNMILHGIETPNLIHSNTLNENVMDIQEKDRHDIILANPPFGGGERKEVQQNFPIRSGETAYLFLQHFIRKLKTGGRAAIVVKDTFLSNPDNAAIALRKELLEATELHTIFDCPQGTFQGAGVKTVVLFFEKGAPTREIWYYQIDPGRSLGKTNPLNDEDLGEAIELQRSRAIGPQSWIVKRAEIDKETYDLSVKNPNDPAVEIISNPDEIIAEFLDRSEKARRLLTSIRSKASEGKWDDVRLGDVVTLNYGKALAKDQRNQNGVVPVYGANGILDWSDHTLTEGPSLVIGRKGSAGAITRVDGPFWPSDVTYFTSHDETRLSFEFLHFSLLILDLPSMARGVKPGINRNEVYDRHFPLPPLDEQLAIVSRLEDVIQSLSEARSMIETNLDSLEELQKNLLQGATTGRIKIIG